ncbi:exosome complex exonuclease Rrp4 [Hamiltosporidium magnivora]|uniref:Exosome complex exonuclease Rrp4 n=1 Tax=Hamiltosporidium magnivora TaxID=148818 RepID=A0A4Q9LE10_9MICR|nr:exosome complex exonuclease Rrp4 [Hamiltosporidium magnivora]
MKKFLPGEKMPTIEGYINGHGSYQENDGLYSSLYGNLVVIDKLMTVQPVIDFRYNPEVGDVIIGRITMIGNKKWKVEMNSKAESTLQLSAINLPGSVQRRKMYSDEMKMREYFDINDILVAEVQKINKSGNISLHTRNEKYKKLTNGLVLEVPAMLVTRYKTQFLKIESIEIIIGVNGFIWIGSDDLNYENMKKILIIANFIKNIANQNKVITDTELLKQY